MGSSDTPAENFDAEVIVGANWFMKLINKLKGLGGKGGAVVQAKDGTLASVDAFQKAGEMII